jgi:tripartite ATP-independent transporter DctM subunit
MLILGLTAIALLALYVLGIFVDRVTLILATAAGLMSFFFLAGLYVSLALGLVALALLFLFADRPMWAALPQILWNINTSFVLVAIPLFVLMGEILERSGLTERMYRALSKWLNPLPGGLMHSNIAACAVFAAVSGSSVATAATISSVALPAFRTRRYDERLVVGSLAAGGTLGILIPPSINMIIYGVLMEESIGRLYIAGVVPGLLLTALFMVVIAVAAIFWPRVAPREQAAPWRERLLGLVTMLPFGLLILLVLGTIYLGVATPTEAAAFGATAALVMAIANRQVNVSMLRTVLMNTATTTSMILLIVTAAFLLNFALVILGVPAAMSRTVSGLGLGPVSMVAALIVFYLVLGTFMDGLSMVVTTLPIILPVLRALHIDLVWFGIILVILTEAALISPPEGLNLYVLHGLRQRTEGASSRATIMDVYVGVLPFLAAMVVTLALVVAFPQIALWLPSLMKGK